MRFLLHLVLASLLGLQTGCRSDGPKNVERSPSDAGPSSPADEDAGRPPREDAAIRIEDAGTVADAAVKHDGGLLDAGEGGGDGAVPSDATAGDAGEMGLDAAVELDSGGGDAGHAVHIDAGLDQDAGGLDAGEQSSADAAVREGGSLDCIKDEGAPPSCLDIDECMRGTDDCDPLATCHNMSNGWTCACPQGYVDRVGDGTQCLPAACWSQAMRWGASRWGQTTNGCSP